LEFNFESIFVAKIHKCTTVIYGVTSQITDIIFQMVYQTIIEYTLQKEKLEELECEGEGTYIILLI